jgi:hypothetical protein
VKRRRVAVALPRPKGTRASSRVELAITMHPRELARLEERAAAASMSLRAARAEVTRLHERANEMAGKLLAAGVERDAARAEADPAQQAFAW